MAEPELMPNGTVSDGCSAWPEGAWHHCCVAHDRAYRTEYPSWWRGVVARRRGDLALLACVAQSGHPVVAILMFFGVRGFGWLPFHRRIRLAAARAGLRARGKADA